MRATPSVVRAFVLDSSNTGDLHGKAFNVGLVAGRSVEELVSMLGRAAGRPVELEPRPPRAGDVEDSCASPERSRAGLEFVPVAQLEGAMAAMIADQAIVTPATGGAKRQTFQRVH